MTEEYMLYTNPAIIDRIQSIQADIYSMETFHFQSDILTYPFRRRFDYHCFLDINHMFTHEADYSMLTKFINSIQSKSFFLSSPHYAVLYPIEVSVECRYETYRNLPSYAIHEMKDYYQYGVGFTGITHRFLFDETANWAFLYDDAYQIIIIGVNQVCEESFRNSFLPTNVLSSTQAIKLMEKYAGSELDESPKNQFLRLYQD